jgi:hypothetical protein
VLPIPVRFLAAIVVCAATASGQWIVDHFDYTPGTLIPNWSTYGGNWQATGSAVESDWLTGWQFLLRDGVSDRDCAVETVVTYSAPPWHLQFGGPMTRATIDQFNELRCLMVKSQDNHRNGTGLLNTAYLYYYKAPLGMFSLATQLFPWFTGKVRTRIITTDEVGQARVIGYWDLNVDGIWDLQLFASTYWLNGVSGNPGLCGFSSCFMDDWKFFNATLYSLLTVYPPGATVEYVARGTPNYLYLAGSSFSNAGIPLPNGRAIPLYPDPLLVLSLNDPLTFQEFTGVFDSNGDAKLKVVIPRESELLGITFYTAFVTLDSLGAVVEISNDAQVSIR